MPPAFTPESGERNAFADAMNRACEDYFDEDLIREMYAKAAYAKARSAERNPVADVMNRVVDSGDVSRSRSPRRPQVGCWLPRWLGFDRQRKGA